MARKLRIEYPGAIYHIMSRGDHREPVYRDDKDYKTFLETFAQTCAKTQWQVHAWCLMHNHFHLVFETPQPNLVAGMKWLLGTYTGRFNRRHKLFGHLFSGRYKSIIVDGSGDGYLRTVCDYVHLNPARANIITADQPLHDYPWSSYPDYLKPAQHRPPWLRVDRLLGEMQIPKDSRAGRQHFQATMEQRRSDPCAETAVDGSWCFGSETFRQELLAQVTERRGPNHYGREIRESAEQKAERLIAEELTANNWSNAELDRWKKGDARKLVLAERLRSETTMTIAWIASRLRAGSPANLNSLLYQRRLEENRAIATPPLFD